MFLAGLRPRVSRAFLHSQRFVLSAFPCFVHLPAFDPRPSPARPEPPAPSPPGLSCFSPSSLSLVPDVPLVGEPEVYSLSHLFRFLSSHFPSPAQFHRSPSPFPRYPLALYHVDSLSALHSELVVIYCLSGRQMRALSEGIYRDGRLKGAGFKNPRLVGISGRQRSDWQSVDLGAFKVEIFNLQHRVEPVGLEFISEEEIAANELKHRQAQRPRFSKRARQEVSERLERMRKEALMESKLNEMDENEDSVERLEISADSYEEIQRGAEQKFLEAQIEVVEDRGKGRRALIVEDSTTEDVTINHRHPVLDVIERNFGSVRASEAEIEELFTAPLVVAKKIGEPVEVKQGE